MKLYLRHNTTNIKYYFESYEEYQRISSAFDLEFITIEYDPEEIEKNIIDEKLFDVFDVSDFYFLSLEEFYKALDLDQDDKLKLVLFGDYNGSTSLDDLDYVNDTIEYYEANSYAELAEIYYQYESFPSCLDYYLNEVYELLSHEMRENFNEFTIDDKTYYYRFNN